MDFFLSPGVNERVCNSYYPRLRHAFITYNNWLFGQTWMTFYNVGSIPENLDFVGPTESTIFGRQAQVRYTRGPWQFSLENPETTITPYGGGKRIVADDNLMQHLETDVSGGTLEIQTEPGIDVVPSQTMEFHVTLLDLEEVVIQPYLGLHRVCCGHPVQCGFDLAAVGSIAAARCGIVAAAQFDHVSLVILDDVGAGDEVRVP